MCTSTNNNPPQQQAMQCSNNQLEKATNSTVTSMVSQRGYKQVISALKEVQMKSAVSIIKKYDLSVEAIISKMELTRGTDSLEGISNDPR
ncbi:hypothetical protein L4D20_03805 [Vibrio kyushuensis]|uniref:hypothetical protein n=1 Tax=Vibrio kyushuensis TaxID=2910249 RepID=UPI003D138514